MHNLHDFVAIFSVIIVNQIRFYNMHKRCDKYEREKVKYLSAAAPAENLFSFEPRKPF